MWDVLSQIANIVLAIPVLLAGILWCYKWKMQPTIEWGFFDCFPAQNASYYLICKRTENLKIKLILKPRVGQPTDYSVKVHRFIKTAEHMQEIKTTSTDEEDNKVIEIWNFNNDMAYRIEINGILGGLFPRNYELIMIAPDTKIKRDTYKLPFREYIKL